MDITLIHENKLKVVLAAEDMRELSLEFDSMDYADPVTRKALISILDRSRGQVRFNPRGAKLFIEAYPCEGGGCVLYFTCLHTGAGEAGVEPVVFEFDSAEELVRGACLAYERYRQRIYRSSLYRWEGRYRLAICPLDYSDRLSVYFLGEYGRKVGEGSLAAAFTEEHGGELIRDNALEILYRYFSDSAAPETGTERD